MRKNGRLGQCESHLSRRLTLFLRRKCGSERTCRLKRAKSPLHPHFSLASPSSPPVKVAQEIFDMTRSKVISGSIVATAIFAGGVLIGKSQVAPSAPPQVTLGANFPNLQAAQRAIVQA